MWQYGKKKWGEGDISNWFLLLILFSDGKLKQCMGAFFLYHTDSVFEEKAFFFFLFTAPGPQLYLLAKV